MANDDYSEFDMDLTTHRYPNRWNEDNWEEEFEQHPLFMTKAPENNQLPPIVEALQQLKYGKEDNTNEELAENYKKDGNLNFKAKKYQIAIDCYTEAIKLKPKSNELKSILHSNRSASHFHLENFRSSLIDAMKAIEFNPKNNKAIEKVITCLNKLKKYEELIKFCDNEEIEIANVDEIKKEAEKNLKIKQRDERKNKTKEEKIKKIKIDYQVKVLKAFKERNIIYRDNIFEVIHPEAEKFKITFNDDNTINYPVFFTYPDFVFSDFIEKFNENSSFMDHLIIMLDDENNLPEWNLNRTLTSKNAKIEYIDLHTEEHILVDKNLTLLQAFTKYKLVINNIVLSFTISCKS